MIPFLANVSSRLHHWCWLLCMCDFCVISFRIPERLNRKSGVIQTVSEARSSMSQSCRGRLSSLSCRWAQVMPKEHYSHPIHNAYCLCYQSTVKKKKKNPSWYRSSPTFIFQRIHITCRLLDFFVLIEQGRVLVGATSWVRTTGMLWGNVWEHSSSIEKDAMSISCMILHYQPDRKGGQEMLLPPPLGTVVRWL